MNPQGSWLSLYCSLGWWACSFGWNWTAIFAENVFLIVSGQAIDCRWLPSLVYPVFFSEFHGVYWLVWYFVIKSLYHTKPSLSSANSWQLERHVDHALFSRLCLWTPYLFCQFLHLGFPKPLFLVLWSSWGWRLLWELNFGSHGKRSRGSWHSLVRGIGTCQKTRGQIKLVQLIYYLIRFN